MTDAEFEALLKPALIRAAELDYMSGIPSEEELDRLVIPSTHFRRKMVKLVSNPKSYIRKLRMPVYQRALRTAAAVLLVISMLFGLSMLNSDVRAKVISFFRTWFSERTEYGIVGDSSGSIPTSVTLGYVPDGFELVFEVYDSLNANLVYQSVDNRNFYITITGEAVRPHVDNEHSEFYSIAVNNCFVDVYKSNDISYPSILVCYDENPNLIIKISGTISVDELVNILESLTY